jgi:hypothetical protein
MRRRRRGLALLLASAAIVATVGRAHAQAPADDADEKERTSLYREGVVLAEAGRWGEALEKFQHVVALRSAPRALLALAAAEEHVGRLVSAKRTYAKARDDARTEHDAALADKAETSLAALAPRVPSLALVVPDAVAGAEARLDGAPVEISARGVEVDPGVYHLVVTAPGMRDFEQRVVVTPGQKKEIAVAMVRDAAPVAPPLVTQPAPAPPQPRAGPPLGAWILGGAGVAAGVAGLVVRLQARNVYDDSKNDVATYGRANDAVDRMVVGTIIAGAGLALVGAGAVWWALSPSPGGDGGTVALGGRF